MSYVIRLVALDDHPVGQWLKSYDPEAHGGEGAAEGTFDLAEALRFPTAGEALLCWRQVPNAKPVRSDGRPNRPLTAFTVEIVPVEVKHE